MTELEQVRFLLASLHPAELKQLWLFLFGEAKPPKPETIIEDLAKNAMTLDFDPHSMTPRDLSYFIATRLESKGRNEPIAAKAPDRECRRKTG